MTTHTAMSAFTIPVGQRDLVHHGDGKTIVSSDLYTHVGAQAEAESSLIPAF
jgi:hypothetical protein